MWKHVVMERIEAIGWLGKHDVMNRLDMTGCELAIIEQLSYSPVFSLYY